MATTYETPKGVGGRINTKTGELINVRKDGKTYTSGTPEFEGAASALNLKTPSIANAPITSASIAPTQPIKPIAPAEANAGAGLEASIETQAKSYADSVVANKDLEESRKAKQDAFTALTERITGTKGKSELTDTTYSKEVDPAKKELDDINNEIRSEQNALRRQKEAIEKNARGATSEAISQEVRAAERESYAKQADLSIIQLARQDRYFGAKEIADRKVAVQLEQDAARNKMLELTYQENKDLFTQQEQRQFEAQQSERTRLLEKESEELKGVNELAINALKNGAPTDVVRRMQQAKTQNDAIAIGGQFVDKLDRDDAALNRKIQLANLAKINAEVASMGGNGIDEKTLNTIQSSNEYKTISGILPAVQTIKKYLSSVQDSGTGEIWNAQKAGEKQAAYGNAIAAWKTLAALGALSGADFGLAENVIPEPTFYARKGRFEGQLNSALDNAVTQTETLTKRLTTLHPKAAEVLGKQLDDIRLTAYPQKISNEQLLNTVPGTNNTSTNAVQKADNSSFFNQF